MKRRSGGSARWIGAQRFALVDRNRPPVVLDESVAGQGAWSHESPRLWRCRTSFRVRRPFSSRWPICTPGPSLPSVRPLVALGMQRRGTASGEMKAPPGRSLWGLPCFAELNRLRLSFSFCFWWQVQVPFNVRTFSLACLLGSSLLCVLGCQPAPDNPVTAYPPFFSPSLTISRNLSPPPPPLGARGGQGSRAPWRKAGGGALLDRP